MYYTYVLFCSKTGKVNSEFYVGSTKDLRNRLAEHNAGEVKTTSKFDKLELVYYEACLNKIDARKRELQLKTGFGRGYLNRRLDSFLNEHDARV